MELLQIRTESEQDSLTTGPPLVGEMVGRGLCGLVTLSLSIYIYITACPRVQLSALGPARAI